MKLKKFFDNDFKQFSVYDTYRSIPNIVDGFKPSMRKVIHGMVKRGENAGEIKVAQAGAYVASVTDYHHGEASLESTIVGLAQDYPGSNNMNLLVPEGQFGSRLTPDAASSRYIFTYLSNNFRKLFKKDDDIILEYLDSDGMSIEPKYFFPILPTVLVNGTKGMGTGFATNIMSYNPEDLRKNILSILKAKKPKEILPWYRGFNGTITKENGQTTIEGKYEIINTTTIKITELPIGTYVDKYNEHLIGLVDKGIIKDYDDNSTADAFEFIIRVPRTTTGLTHDRIMTLFKLISRDTENLTLWNQDGRIQVYESVQDIIDNFVIFRLEKYEERRTKKISILESDLAWLNEKLRFVLFYLDNHDKFAKKSKHDLVAMLEKEKFNDIDRLLSQRIWSLTKDEIDKLKNEIKDVKALIKELKGTTNVEMYIKELEELKV